MKKIMFLVVLFLCNTCLMSCNKSIFKNDALCNEKAIFKKIILATLKIPKLEIKLNAHKSTNDGKIIIVDNNIIKDISKKENFDDTIIFLSMETIIKNKLKSYLEFISIKIKDNKAYVEVFYKYAGMTFTSMFVFVECEWKLVNNSVTED